MGRIQERGRQETTRTGPYAGHLNNNRELLKVGSDLYSRKVFGAEV